ncbi:MAG: hypothetical protein ACI9LE_001529, partial [Paraglaciecola sp.]|jgi:hypothetical protein
MTKKILGNFKLSAMALSLAIGLFACEGDDGVLGPVGTTGEQGDKGSDGATGADGQPGSSVPVLTRLATVPRGAEVTGAFLSEEG